MVSRFNLTRWIYSRMGEGWLPLVFVYINIWDGELG